MGKRFWQAVLHTFGGISSRAVTTRAPHWQKVLAVLRKPGVIGHLFVYVRELLRSGAITPGFIGSAMIGQVKGFNIVMQNFMDESDIQQPRSKRVEQRIDACVFKGVVKRDGVWQTVSMCEMNATVRPEVYRVNLTRPCWILGARPA